MQPDEKIPFCAPRYSRRDMLLRIAGSGILGALSPLLLSKILASPALAEEQRTVPQPASPTTALSPSDDQFLDALEKMNFKYFWEKASPQTGLVRASCNALEKQ